MDYVSLDTALSLKIAKIRAEQTHREVPEAYIRKVNAEIPLIFHRLALSGKVGHLTLWDTNIKTEPRKVATASGGNLKIHDHELWNRFLNKAKK